MRDVTCSLGILAAVFSIHGALLCKAEESRIVSWNSHSRQFIDPPAFQLLSLAKTVKYRAIAEQGGQSWSVESPHPWLDLSPIWGKLPLKCFKLTFRWLDAGGKVLAEETSWRVKAPDWQGFKEPAEDWAAAADRTIAYLIRVGQEGTAPYREPEMPVWMWSAASPTPKPTRQMLGPAYENKRVLEEFRNRHKWAGSGHPAAYPAYRPGHYLVDDGQCPVASPAKPNSHEDGPYRGRLGLEEPFARQGRLAAVSLFDYRRGPLRRSP